VHPEAAVGKREHIAVGVEREALSRPGDGDPLISDVHGTGESDHRGPRRRLMEGCTRAEGLGREWRIEVHPPPDAQIGLVLRATRHCDHDRGLVRAHQPPDIIGDADRGQLD
jgi:hypothetical protein